MYILHGTWIPDESDTFIQSGQFYLWVETATAHRRRSPGVHPGHLKKDELASFPQDILKIAPLAAMSRAVKQTKPTIEPEIVSFLVTQNRRYRHGKWRTI